MSIALNYQLSILGKYSVSPTPETITTLMTQINQETQETFLPNVINSQQVVIPSNRIATISNLGFVSQDQRYNIAILNERIDITYNRISDSEVSLEAFYEFATKALAAIIQHSNLTSSRLAFNIQQICELNSLEDLKKMGKELLKSPAYYSDKDFSEWSMHTTSQSVIQIGESQEGINVITRIISALDITGEKAAVLFQIDINTLPKNVAMRFGKDALNPFVQNVIPIAKNIIADVERLITVE